MSGVRGLYPEKNCKISPVLKKTARFPLLSLTSRTTEFRERYTIGVRTKTQVHKSHALEEGALGAGHPTTFFSGTSLTLRHYSLLHDRTKHLQKLHVSRRI